MASRIISKLGLSCVMLMNDKVEALKNTWVNKLWYIHMMEYYYIAGFLNLSTSGPCCGDCPVHCRMVSSNFPPTSSCDNQKMNVSRHYQISPRGKIVPGWQSLLWSNEKEQILTTHKQCDNMEDSHKHNLGQKRPYTEECVIHNSIYMKFKTRQN